MLSAIIVSEDQAPTALAMGISTAVVTFVLAVAFSYRIMYANRARRVFVRLMRLVAFGATFFSVTLGISMWANS